MGKESYDIATLGNGIDSCLVHVPKATALYANIEFPTAGWRYSSPTKPEIAHLMEHMIFKGCEAYPSADQFLGALALDGADYNAFTDTDRMSYVLQSPKSGDLASLRSFTKALSAPLFTRASLETERRVVREELMIDANLDECRLWPAIYRAMGYDIHTNASRLQTLNDITPGDMRRHYYKTHRADGARATVSGDMSHGRANAIRRMLGAIELPGGPRREEPRRNVHSPRYPVLVNRHDKSNITYTAGWFELDKPLQEDVAAGELLSVNLFKYPHAELMHEARERGLVYGIGGGLLDDYADRYAFLIWGDVGNRNAVPLFRLIQSKMTETLEGVNATKFERVRRFALGQMSLAMGDVEYLHNRAAEQFRNYDDVRPAAELVKAIRDITPDEYLESVRRLLQGGVATAGAIGKDIRQKSRFKNELWQTQDTLANVIAA